MRIFLTPLSPTPPDSDDKDWQLQFRQLPSFDELREIILSAQPDDDTVYVQEDVVFYIDRCEVTELPSGLDAESVVHMQYGRKRRDWRLPDVCDSEKLSDWISAIVQTSERGLVVGTFDGSLYRIELGSRACQRIRKFPHGISQLCHVEGEKLIVGLQSGKFSVHVLSGTKERGIPESMVRTHAVSHLSFTNNTAVNVGYEDGCLQEWSLSAGLKWSLVKEQSFEYPIIHNMTNVVVTEQSIIAAGKAMQMRLQRHISCACHLLESPILATGHPNGHINVFSIDKELCERLFTLSPDGAGWITGIRLVPTTNGGFVVVAVGQDGFLRVFDCTAQSGRLRAAIHVGCKLVCLETFRAGDSLWVHVGGEDCIVHSYRLLL